MPTSGTSPGNEDWKHSVERRIGKIEDDMVTKSDFATLERTVNKQGKLVGEHDRLIIRGRNVLVYLGIATLVAALVSPHAAWLKNLLDRWFAP